MDLSVRTNASRYEKGDVRSAVSFALNSASVNARQRLEHYAGICKTFEKKHKMTSEKFLEQFEAGKLGDEQEFFDWYAATRGLKLWRKRDGILSGDSR